MTTRREQFYARLGKLGEDDDEAAEYARWDELGDEARFDAAWDLVVSAFEIRGRDPDELRFQRSVENLQLAVVTEDDFLGEGVFYQIGLVPNGIDIITSVPGIDFSSAYSNRENVTIADISVPFIGKGELIDSESSAGRPQDLVDAGALARRKQAF